MDQQRTVTDGDPRNLRGRSRLCPPLDDLHPAKENKASTLGKPIEYPIFPEGNAPKG